MFKYIKPNPSFAGVADVEPQEVLDNSEQLQIVDVREPDEFVGDLGHIAGAKLVSLGTLPVHLDKIDKNKPTVLVCRSGGRSAKATAFLASQGYKNIFNMRGGMMLWNDLHLKIERS